MEINLDNQANEQFITDLHDLVFDALGDDAEPVGVIGALLVASFDLVQRGGGDADDFVGIATQVAEVGEQHEMLAAMGEMDEVKEALENDDVELAAQLLEDAFDSEVEIVDASEASDGSEESSDNDMMFQ